MIRAAALKAQFRLCTRYGRPQKAGKPQNVIVVAIAREIALTCFPFLGPVQVGKFQFRFGPKSEVRDEGIEVYGGADRVRLASGGGRDGHLRGVPQGGDQRRHILQLAQEVCGSDAVGDEAAEATRGGERQAEEAGGRPFARQSDVAGRAVKKAVGPARRRALVDEVRAGWKVSIRRACRVLRTDTSTYHYKGKRASQAGLTKRIKEIAETRVRYGYRRIHVLLQREGWPVNAKRIYRLYEDLGLQLRNKTPKRRVKAKLRNDRRPAVQANETWAELLKILCGWAATES